MLFQPHTVQFSSVTRSCLTLCDPMTCSIPGLPVHNHLPEYTQTHVHWVGNAIQPSHPLLSPCPPALNLSQRQGLAWGGQSIGISASASVLPMNIQDWLDLLAAQGTLKNLLPHHSSKTSILWCSAFFIATHNYLSKNAAATQTTRLGSSEFTNSILI